MTSVLPQAAKLGEIALNFLFPQKCISCGKEGSFVCDSCHTLLTWITPPFCPKCGRHQISGALCPSCVSWKTEIDGIRSPFHFDGLMREAIYQLKYKNLRALVVPLAHLLYDYLITNPIPGETLVPVPLHQKRLRERGYNQSNLLARELSKLSNLPVVDDCLARQHSTPPQARTANVKQRQNNVANAFICYDEKLKDKRVLLIDDVSTSGATLNACAAALKSAGAASVWGLTMAREI